MQISKILLLSFSLLISTHVYSQLGSLDDFDGDSILNIDDLDDDNDGITDIEESGHNCGESIILDPGFFSGSYHSHVINRENDVPLVTGDLAAPGGGTNGSADILTSHLEVTPANGYNYTGDAIKAQTAGQSAQYILQTTTGLYAWGENNNPVQSSGAQILPSTITVSGITTSIGKAFQPIPIPATVTASDIADFFISNGGMAILTTTGEIWIINNGEQSYIEGDGTESLQDDEWHLVSIAGTPLTDIVHFEMTDETVFAITGSNDWYTWGKHIYRGNGTNAINNQGSPNLMTKPASFTSAADVELVTMTQNTEYSSRPSYYVLHATEKKVYVLGDNSSGQLGIGDISTTNTVSEAAADINRSVRAEQNIWTKIQNETGTGDLENVLFIHANNNNDKLAAAGVIVNDPTVPGDHEMLLFGQNELSASSVFGDGYNLSYNLYDKPENVIYLDDLDIQYQVLPKKPQYDTTPDNSTFTGGQTTPTYIDVNGDATIDELDIEPIVLHMAGHFTIYYDFAQKKYAYVGHNDDGAFGDTPNYVDRFVVTGSPADLGDPRPFDFDEDGIPNCYDLDSDNDGIYDILESQDPIAIGLDADGDGTIEEGTEINSASDDIDNDGLIDAIEAIGGNQDTGVILVNTDGTDLADPFDQDADDDGCSDANEVYGDQNADGGDGAAYGTGSPLTLGQGQVSVVGRVLELGTDFPGSPQSFGYQIPADLNSNSIYDYLETHVALDSISSQPTDNLVLTDNSTQTFTAVVATSNTGGSISYQWQESTISDTTGFVNIADDGLYSGTTTTTLTLTGVTPNMHENYYRLLATTDLFVCDPDLTSDAAQIIFFETVAENDINQTPQSVPVDGNILTNDTDPNGDVQVVQTATGLDAAGNPVSIPLDGTPTLTYNVNGMLSGTIAIMPDGTYTFDPDPAFIGSVVVDYVVVDAHGATDSATLDIDVISADIPNQNDPPIANDDTNSTEMDVDVSSNVITSNDADPEGDVLTISAALVDKDGDGILNDPLVIGIATPIYGIDDTGNPLLSGTITLNPDGTYIFNPELTFTGVVHLDYTIDDGNGGTDDATLTITIEPDKDNNTYANDDASTGNVDIPQAGNVLTNDNDPEADAQLVSGGTAIDGTTFISGVPVTLPSGGTLISNTNGPYDYIPAPSFVGTEVVVYEVCDNGTPQACEFATLYLTTLPINTITAEEDFNNTPFNTPITATVATNDKDIEDNNLTFTPLGVDGGMPASEGILVMNPDGTYTYFPALGFAGETQFDYEVCDDGIPSLCTTSTLFIEVFPVINPETSVVIANPDANTFLEGQTGIGNVIANDLDPDGINPTVTSSFTGTTVAGVDVDGNPVANAGSLTLNPDGTYSFTPTTGFIGIVTQPYTICDGTIPAICDDTELIIDIISPKNNTTFSNDDAAVTDAGIMVPGDVLTNDTDGDGDTQSVTDFLVDTNGDGNGDTQGTIGVATTVGGFNDFGIFVANAGMITLNPDGTFEFLPAPGFIGNANIIYTKCDDVVPAACDDATLVLTVLDVFRDYGDGPAIYPIAYHRVLTDWNGDNILDGATDVWLGLNTSFETAQQFDAIASTDTNDDAITFGNNPGQFPLNASPNTLYNIDITLNSTAPDLVFYGMWIDWNEDGIYDDFYNGSVVTASPTTTSVPVMTPNEEGLECVNIRLRADDDPFAITDFEGGLTNGEVEDYKTAILLPVELIYFSGSETDCQTTLSWATESETNFKQFEIQKSLDGNTFETIRTFESRGTESLGATYEHNDNNLDARSYYRLKMIDIDNLFVYSKTIRIDADCDNSETRIVIYPNPISIKNESLKVEYKSKFNTSGNISILHKSGREVLNISNEFIIGINPMILDISNLAVGAYTLTITTGSEITTETFIISQN